MNDILCYIVQNSTEKVVLTKEVKAKVKIFICENENEGLKILNDAKTLFSNAAYFPPKDIFFYSSQASSNDLIEQRIKILNSLIKGEDIFIVTTIEASLEKINKLNEYEDMTISLSVNDEVDIKKLRKDLVESGYINVTRVYNKGEFSQRGSIVDIYSYTLEYPVRIEFFDEEVDSIRYFDPETQRGIENIRDVKIFIAKDSFSSMEETSLLEMTLGKDAALILDEPSKIDIAINNFQTMYVDQMFDKMIDFNLAKNIIRTSYTLAFSELDCGSVFEGIINVYTESKSIKNYNGDIFAVVDEIKKLIKNDYKINIYCASSSRAHRILDEFIQHGIVSAINDMKDDRKIVSIFTSSLVSSFIDEKNKTVYISDTHILKVQIEKGLGMKKNENTEVIKNFSELRVDDIVVHDNYGIGRYKGIECLTVNGVKKDYLKIEYKNNSELYILATNLSSVQKYIGNTSLITLSDLNTDRWSKSKAKVKKQTDIIAKEIVELYSRRLNKTGYCFSRDDELQKEMEELFEFVETDDQLKVIDEVKNDMESPKIMDRLLCGDVGFGKTEVAIRAAFKAVNDGKQVAILVPTTILASQHFNLIKRRLEKFPIRVEMLSRFITGRKQKEIIEDIGCGKVDIIVGTQSILRKDIKFKDLGLLIIDEEQRFGVKDKEKIKSVKLDVDTLALSATPIPRTLHMSLSGIRDLSLLTQAPYDRQPIQTYVLEYKENLVKEAILREANRSGQVYFLHNNIKDIEDVADNIRKLVPGLIIETAHSKLGKSRIEDVFYRFNNREIDVLVSTTIVETGLDIPNVNTIIINNADKFGLSTLYQLKGRVGRSGIKAYAYLMYKKSKNLTTESVERLKSIREFNRLGSGIRIAMKDMEIRGCGSVLGNIQHGHIEAVGYDLYCKILKQSLAEAKGEVADIEMFEPIIDININAHIDENYIAAEIDKMEMYKKFNSIYSKDDMYDVIDECIDRFGEIPADVENIIKIGYIKNVSMKVGIEKIIDSKGNLYVYFSNEPKINKEEFVEYLNINKETHKFTGGIKSLLVIKYCNLLEDLIELVNSLKNMLY